VKRFGESWGAPICDPEHGVPLRETPVGEDCIRCGQPIEEGDQGVSLPYIGFEGEPPEIHYHLDCFLDSTLGPFVNDHRRKP